MMIQRHPWAANTGIDEGSQRWGWDEGVRFHAYGGESRSQRKCQCSSRAPPLK